MGKSKAKVQRFDAVNKSRIRGRKGHTRTGACPSRGKCYHGLTYREKRTKHAGRAS